MRILSLCFIAAWSFTVGADCTSNLKSSSYQALVRQVGRLNPVLPVGANAQELFLTLKREREVVNQAELSVELEQHLRQSQAQYDLADLSREQVRLFYLNALHHLIHRAADLWREEEAERLSATPLARDVKDVATHLIDSYISPFGLNEDELSARQAEEYFRTRPWLAFPWDRMLPLIGEFQQTGQSPHEFPKWLERRAGSILGWSDVNRVVIALTRDRRPGGCCLASAPCTVCPHNRFWLRH